VAATPLQVQMIIGFGPSRGPFPGMSDMYVAAPGTILRKDCRRDLHKLHKPQGNRNRHQRIDVVLGPFDLHSYYCGPVAFSSLAVWHLIFDTSLIFLSLFLVPSRWRAHKSSYTVDTLLQTISAHMPKAGLLENVPFIGYELPGEESGLEYIKETLQNLGYVVQTANFDLKDWHAVRRYRTRRMYSAHGVTQQHVHVVCSVASKRQH
jgi:hypothetical protein